jgi:YD repeat-containing protein
MQSIDAFAARRTLLRPFVLFVFVLMSWFVAPHAHAESCAEQYAAAGAYPGDPACTLKAATGRLGLACYNTNAIANYCAGHSPGGTDEPLSPDDGGGSDGDKPDGNFGGAGGNGGSGGGDTSGGGCGGSATAGCGSTAGDPVKLYTGQFHLVAHDLHVADTIALDLARVYRSSAYDTTGQSMAGIFGVGATFVYDSYLTLSAEDSDGVRQLIEIRLPSGVRIPFIARPDNSSIWEDLTSPGDYYRATITNGDRNGSTKVLTLRDGRVWRFTMVNDLYRLSSVQDRNGNAVTIARDGNTGAITTITSPNGRALTFTSFTGSRGTQLISRVTDPLSRQVNYAYDGEDRLIQVTDADGGVWKYGWDIKSRLVRVTDPEGNIQVVNTYDESDRVTFQKLADDSTFGFAYTFTGGKVAQAEVTDRRGSVRRVEFDANGRIVRNTYPAGLSIQQVQTFTYDEATLVSRYESIENRVWKKFSGRRSRYAEKACLITGSGPCESGFVSGRLFTTGTGITIRAPHGSSVRIRLGEPVGRRMRMPT